MYTEHVSHMHVHVCTCRSPLLVTFVHIPAWYLFYDLFAMFDAFTLRKNLRHLSWGRQLRLYIVKKSGLVCHHIILFLFGYLLVAVSGVYMNSIVEHYGLIRPSHEHCIIHTHYYQRRQFICPLHM